jgi:hypothetical protein
LQHSCDVLTLCYSMIAFATNSIICHCIIS